jgi:hypothetical protein
MQLNVLAAVHASQRLPPKILFLEEQFGYEI